MSYVLVDHDSVNSFTSKEAKTIKNATKPFFAKQLEKKKVVRRK